MALTPAERQAKYRRRRAENEADANSTMVAVQTALINGGSSPLGLLVQRSAETIFVREDWQLFLSPQTLGQKAGCPQDRLRRMALKELADNALDAGSESVTVEEIDENTFAVADAGPGLSRSEIESFFAVSRPMTTSKLWRAPTRGTLGNGLRVVTGAAHASGGTLIVESRGERHEITIDTTTGKAVLTTSSSSVDVGLKATISFGSSLPPDDKTMCWAEAPDTRRHGLLCWPGNFADHNCG